LRSRQSRAAPQVGSVESDDEREAWTLYDHVTRSAAAIFVDDDDAFNKTALETEQTSTLEPFAGTPLRSKVAKAKLSAVEAAIDHAKEIVNAALSSPPSEKGGSSMVSIGRWLLRRPRISFRPLRTRPTFSRRVCHCLLESRHCVLYRLKRGRAGDAFGLDWRHKAEGAGDDASRRCEASRPPRCGIGLSLE